MKREATRSHIPEIVAVLAAISMITAFPSWAFTPTDAGEDPVVLSLFAVVVVCYILRSCLPQHRDHL